MNAMTKTIAAAPPRKSRTRAPVPIPPRVAERPSPSQWLDDETLTYWEGAALFFPTGKPLTVDSLRNAARKGRLAFVEVGGRHLTTPAAIRDLLRPTPHGRPVEPMAVAVAPSPVVPPVAAAPPSRPKAVPSRGRRRLEEALARSSIQR